MVIPRPLKFPRNIQDISNGWVVRNIRKYGNSALPTCLLEIMEEETISRLLTEIIKEKITVRKTENGYIVEK